MANYNAADNGCVLTVSMINKNGVAVDSESFTAAADWADIEVEFNATGDFYIEFSTANSTDKKRVNVDDITVAYKSSQSVTLIESVTTTATSHNFTELEGDGVYRYRVSASDSYTSSEFSAYEGVTIFPTSIDSIITDGNSLCEVYTVGGVLIYSGSKDNIPALAPGTYVVKCGSITMKVSL